MMQFLLKCLATALKRRLNPAHVDAALRKLPPAKQVSHDTRDVTVCALQLEAKAYPNLSAWLSCLDTVLSRAAAQGAQLVCLPEFYGLMPYFFLPAVRLALPLAARIPVSAENQENAAPADLAVLLGPFAFVQSRYEAILCRLAARHGLYLFGGTGPALEGRKVYNRGFLVSPLGKVLARQDKLHLTAEERAMGFSPGEELSVVPTPLGNIALCVCMDATYFETFRIAKGLGADYIIVPIGDMAEFNHWLSLRGAQLRVNETGLAAIKPALVSAPGFPVTFTGKAGIFFPDCTDLPSREAAHSCGEDCILSSFPLAQLRRGTDPLFHRENRAFDANYLRTLEAVCAKEPSQRRFFRKGDSL